MSAAYSQIVSAGFQHGDSRFRQWTVSLALSACGGVHWVQ